MTHLGEIYIENQMLDTPRKRRGNRHPDFAPQGVYKCRGEDNWIAISIKTDEDWSRFKAIVEDKYLSSQHFETLSGRQQGHNHIDEIINKWTYGQDRYEVLNRLQKAEIPSGVVLDCGADSYADPHLNERDIFQVVDHPAAGLHPMTGPIFKFNSAEGQVIHNPAPCLGQDNMYILKEVLGYGENKIKLLEANEIIGTVPLTGSDMGGSRRIANKN